MDTLPRDIHIGMKVFDSRHHAIGKVDDFKFPENAIDPDVEPAEVDRTDTKRETILTSVAEAFGGKEIPEALRNRLLVEGYIRLDTAGLFTADRYILPSQIASASGDEVVLNVEKDELIKR
jgi:hypothetical protein